MAIITSAGVFAPAIFGWIVAVNPSPVAGYQAAVLMTGIVVLIGGIIGLVLIDPSREAVRLLPFATAEEDVPAPLPQGRP